MQGDGVMVSATRKQPKVGLLVSYIPLAGKYNPKPAKRAAQAIAAIVHARDDTAAS